MTHKPTLDNLTRALDESARDAAYQRDKLSGDHLMDETWPWTNEANFSSEAMPRSNDREGGCLGETLASAAGLVSLIGGTNGGAVDSSDGILNQSFLSCFEFSASFPYFRTTTSPSN